ncbi:MAG: hypothetical protein R2726_07815 [Acidimicrobiales bacterium]
MTVALIDDQLLGAVLRGQPPRTLASKTVYTTGYWYVRLGQAVLGAQERTGVLSRPFVELPDAMRERALAAALELPAEIGLLSLRELGPIIAQLRLHHQLDILGIEALAAATRLQANVYLSARSPQLEQALRSANLTVKVQPRER